MHALPTPTEHLRSVTHPVGNPDPTVLSLLRQAEACGDREAGALLVGRPDRVLGTILVERGRVCWAVAKGMRQRMTDLLRAQRSAPLEPECIETIYRTCQREGRPLGEALVQQGIVSEDGLRAALLEHTSEALSRMVDRRPEHSWFVPHRLSDYNARFTFSAAELWLYWAQPSRAVEARAGEAIFDRLPADWSGPIVSFDRSRWEGGPTPVVAINAESLPLASVAALGRWACEALDLASAMDDETRLTAGTLPDGQAVVAWRDRALIYAALCTDTLQLATLLSRTVPRRSA